MSSPVWFRARFTGIKGSHCHRSCQASHIIPVFRNPIHLIFLISFSFSNSSFKSHDHQRLWLWWLWRRYRVVDAGDILFPVRVRRISVTVGRRNASRPGRRHGSGKRWREIRIIVPIRSRARLIGYAGTPITGSVTERHILSRRSATGICRRFGTNAVVRELLSRWTLWRLQRWTRQDRAKHQWDHGFRVRSGWCRWLQRWTH